MTQPVQHLRPPYYAVIFTTRHSGEDIAGYQQMAQRMNELAAQQDGFLGIEAAAGDLSALRITVSYWRDEDAIRRWQRHAEHRIAQETGKSTWYRCYQLRVCRVEREYGKPAAAVKR